MQSEQYPQLIVASTRSSIPVTGRVFTIGASAECKLQLPGRNVPAVAAHLLFKNGAYTVQSLTDEIPVTVNDTRPAGPLKHGDRIMLGNETLVFAERRPGADVQVAPVPAPEPALPSVVLLHDLVNAVAGLLHNTGEAVFSDLVTAVSKLLQCDAARLVEEHPATGERKTIERYPRHSGLERFSNRAIDWAKTASRTVIMQEDEWRDEKLSARSLEKNLVASVLCAPLREGDTVLGYLYLDRLQGNDPFTEQDRAFCDSLLPLFSEILAKVHEHRRQRETIARLQEQKLQPSGGMLFESDAMKKLIELASRSSRTDSPVLILGETGTGKELLARFVHDQSKRSDKPFKAINCGALPEQLIESELFGHEKGSFTGATTRKNGLFEAANGGSVFLDEIGEMPLHLQVRLLRVLQEGEFSRVGGVETIRADVRIIAATNKNLEREVAEGKFRQDLYFRLNVLTLSVPPLRDRGSDITLLSGYFIQKYCQQFGLPHKTLSAAAQEALCAHRWPGNIRELENSIQKAILLSPSHRINVEDIPFNQIALSTHAAIPRSTTLREARESAEKSAIHNALAKAGGNVSQASRLLDIDRKWLIKKMEEFGIEAGTYRK
ncbi:MAG: sigma 54-interacting transcriptional regulator [Chitinispirillaceae bacterium]|nr:sigma 54-interacting transcriptional regulator [Chitinispirillaceae bacterium]